MNYPNQFIYTDYIRTGHTMIRHLFIPGNVPSSKNSKKIIQVPSKNSMCCNALVVTEKIRNQTVPICTACRKTTKRQTFPKLMWSDTVERYIKSSKQFYESENNHKIWRNMVSGLDLPIYLGMYFLRDSAREWDFNNANQIICDLLKEYGYILDDNTSNLIPVYLGHHKNNENPGIIMIALRDHKQSIINSLTTTYAFFQKP